MLKWQLRRKMSSTMSSKETKGGTSEMQLPKSVQEASRGLL